MHPESYWDAVEREPAAIVADAGSGDIGPHYLGSGAEYNPREWEKHDLRLMLLAARKLGAPMIVGSAGGAGTNAAVDRYLDIVREIAAEERLAAFTIATIYSEVDLDSLERRAQAETIEPLGGREPLTADDVRNCSRVVAMMGVEPIVDALDAGADVVLAGRACDDALFAAVPIREGHDRGLALHMGKTLECGPLVATPIVMREAIMGTIRGGDFLLEPFHPDQRCTPMSVAGHTLYERLNPYTLPVPGGTVDMHEVRFEAHTDRICRVSGSRWVPSDTYRVKLEGSGFVGHQAIFVFGLRDPLSIRNVDLLCDGIRDEVEKHYGPSEQTPHISSHEICVVVEAVAPEAADAKGIAKLAKYSSFRVNYPGKLGTAGGSAMFADEIYASAIPRYRWVIDHLLRLEYPAEVFPTTMTRVGG
jgi:hypothetical protein